MESIILNELNRQIALRVKEKIDRMLSVHAYLSKNDIDKLINNVLNQCPEELDKEQMFQSISVRLYCNIMFEYDAVDYGEGKQFIVNKDRVSKEIFEEMEGNK